MGFTWIVARQVTYMDSGATGNKIKNNTVRGNAQQIVDEVGGNTIINN
jgi:hypothetical protein